MEHIGVRQKRVPGLGGFLVCFVFELAREHPHRVDDVVALRVDRAAPGKGRDCVQVGPSVAPIDVKGHQFAILSTVDWVLQA